MAEQRHRRDPFFWFGLVGAITGLVGGLLGVLAFVRDQPASPPNVTVAWEAGQSESLSLYAYDWDATSEAIVPHTDRLYLPLVVENTGGQTARQAELRVEYTVTFGTNLELSVIDARRQTDEAEARFVIPLGDVNPGEIVALDDLVIDFPDELQFGFIFNEITPTEVTVRLDLLVTAEDANPRRSQVTLDLHSEGCALNMISDGRVSFDSFTNTGRDCEPLEDLLPRGSD